MALTLDDLTDIAIGSARGARAKPLHMSVTRELQGSDLDLILNPPEKGIVAPVLAKLRNSHHMLARLLAEGRRPGECALVTGYSPSRISILQHDPAFQELIAYYKTNVEAKFLDVHERLATLGLSSIDELQERLESDPDSFKNRELMELAEFALDRSLTKDQRAAKGGVAASVSVMFVGAPPPESGASSLGQTSERRPIEIEGALVVEQDS